jgi:hypothetical protein
VYAHMKAVCNSHLPLRLVFNVNERGVVWNGLLL